MYNHTINCVIAAWRGVFIVPGGAKGIVLFLSFKRGKIGVFMEQVPKLYLDGRGFLFSLLL
jgi:hypothetical protein